MLVPRPASPTLSPFGVRVDAHEHDERDRRLPGMAIPFDGVAVRF